MSEGAVMRLGHFPTPHPDELLYSLCARFSARVRYSSSKSVIEDLVGTTGATATVDLPNNLGQLATALPAGSPLTAERLIKQHTLLPFFSAFLPPERVTQLEGDMRGGCGQAGYMRSGVMASRIPTPRHLRFCPVCIQEDVRRFREAYWHRTHQVSGVVACPTHEVFLEDGNVSRCAGRHNLQFITADDATRALPPQRLDFSDHDHQVLLQIARDVAWLLEHPSPGSAPGALHNRHLRLLIGRGLATYTGSIHVKALLDEFTRHYSANLLKLLHCEFTGSDHTKTNWLLRLVRPPKHAQHPLYHLLLMQFLGCSAEEFFRVPDEFSLFGEGPWPCLNPAADHHREPIIQECRLSARLRNGRPVSTFSCECGFSYARSGPDSSPEDRFRAGRIISFGPIWEAKLKGLWKDSSLSMSEVGRHLGVDPLTVRRHATRLKLPSSRSSRKSKPLPHAARLKGTHDSTANARKQRAYRAKWVSATRQMPKTSLKALRLNLPREYAWLRQNDVNWLMRHSPLNRRRDRPTSSVDWKKRDAKYAVVVRATATRLRNNPGRPVHVTRSAIGRAVGATTLLRQKLHKMPLTAQVIAGVVETRVEYAVRRIRWAAECFTHERTMPRPWQLMLRASVYSLRSVSEVKSAVDAALCLIDSNLSLNQKLTA
jgi:Tn7-like transposition protein D/TniQ